MLNVKFQSHSQSLVHSQARSVERTVSAVDAKSANGAPCLDNYEFLRTVGVGANATVYLVQDKRTFYMYALKAVDKYTLEGRKIACSTVLSEQAALTKLNGNDFILPLHACFHDSENYYLVTEYLPGGDLAELQRIKFLDVDAVRFYMAELLLAIEHVHAHNIIHRDIKPENIFIDTDGHVVLGDFGISWLFDDSNTNAHVKRGRVGTPAFSSPEVLFGDEYSYGADLWAFGVILYEMLSGREAFRTETVPADHPTWLRHLSEHVKSDELVMDESSLMTEDVVDLVEQLLKKDLNSRLSDIPEIKKHAFFATIDWIRVASRSLTAPWVPLLVSTRQVGVHFEQPVVYAGEQYTTSNDPLPNFVFQAEPSLLSPACERRQQVFGVLDGCAPLVSWVDGHRCEGAMAHPVKRQNSLKSLSKWVKKALNRPVRT